MNINAYYAIKKKGYTAARNYLNLGPCIPRNQLLRYQLDIEYDQCKLTDLIKYGDYVKAGNTVYRHPSNEPILKYIESLMFSIPTVLKEPRDLD